MATNIVSCSEKPWQSSLVGSKQKLNALFYNGNFSDLTISFPGQDIEYKAHRLIMAMSSSIFERMLFGPMAIKGSELELPGDNPKAFKIVLGCCYDVDIETSDIDVALEVYMLLDKYFMEEVAKKCACHIGKLLNTENVHKVLEFATRFNFDALKGDTTKFLLVIQPDRLQELLESDIKISHLLFQDSWRNPDVPLCDDIVMKILKSNCCVDPGLKTFSGCVSAKVVSNITWFKEKEDIKELRLSFTNAQQAVEVIKVAHACKFITQLSIHLQCNKIPLERLHYMRFLRIKSASDNAILSGNTTLPFPISYNTSLFISNVDDHSIGWVIVAADSIIPGSKNTQSRTIYFPESKLTFSGLKKLMIGLKENSPSDVVDYSVEICSSELASNKNVYIQRWISSNLPGILPRDVKLFDRNEDIPSW